MLRNKVYAALNIVGLAATARLMSMPKRTIWFEDKMLNVGGHCYRDDTFFAIFSYDFILDNPAAALKYTWKIQQHGQELFPHLLAQHHTQ